MKKVTTALVAASLLASLNAYAQLKVEISGVGSNQIPVAVAAFADENLAPSQASAIIKADLERSGMFKIIDAGTVSNVNDVDYSQWKSRGANAIVVGSVSKLANGAFDVRYKLFDTIKATKLLQLDRVGVAGQSAGGHTALSLAGGVWSAARFVAHCQAHMAEDFNACVGTYTRLTGGWLDSLKKASASGVLRQRFNDPEPVSAHDPRIAAAGGNASLMTLGA
eukprot:gene23657-29898_t